MLMKNNFCILHNSGIDSCLQPADEVSLVLSDPRKQFVLEVTQVKEQDLVLDPGADPYSLDLGGLPGKEPDALGIAGKSGSSVDLEFGLVSCSRELLGQFIVQLDDRAVSHDDVLETFELVRQDKARVAGEIGDAVGKALLEKLYEIAVETVIKSGWNEGFRRLGLVGPSQRSEGALRPDPETEHQDPEQSCRINLSFTLHVPDFGCRLPEPLRGEHLV